MIEVKIPSELIANSYRKKLRGAARNEAYLFDSDAQSYVKTLFPINWDSARIQRAADSIFNNPSSREFTISETSLAREGVFEGVHVRVIFSPDGSINTVYPIRPPAQRLLH